MSNVSSPAIPFIYYREYFRVVALAYLTEEGTFKEQPESITSPVLTVEVVYRICVSTAGGELQIVDFDNPPMMDKDKKVGGDVTIDGEVWYTEDGPGSTATPCTLRYSTMAPSSLQATARFMYDVASKRENILPLLD